MRINTLLALALFVTSWANAQQSKTQSLVASAVDQLKANQPTREPLGVKSRGDLLGFRLGMNIAEFEEHLNDVVAEQIIQEIRVNDNEINFTQVTPAENSQVLEQWYEIQFCAGFVCNVSVDYNRWGQELTGQVRQRYVDKYGPFVTTDDVFSTIEANIQNYVRANNVLEGWERLYEREVAEANRRMSQTDQSTGTERQYQQVGRLQQYVEELTMEYETIVDRFADYQITIENPSMLNNTLELAGRFPMRMECEQLLGPVLSYPFCSPNEDRIVWNDERAGIAESWALEQVILTDAAGQSPEFLAVRRLRNSQTFILRSKAVSEAINAVATGAAQKNRTRAAQDITI